MSNPAHRYRYGDCFPVRAPFALGVAINEGDLCYLDTVQVTPPDNQTQNEVRPAGQFTYQTAIADPTTAPTIAAVSATNVGPGFTVSGSGIAVAYTYLTSDGLESGPSPLSSRMATNGSAIQVTGVTVPAGIVAVNYYVTTDGGAASTLQLVMTSPYGMGVTIGGPPPSTAQGPPAAGGLSALVLSQVAFAKKFLGISGQSYGGESPITTYGVKDQYIRVLTGGVYDFSCASANWNDGDLIAIANVGSALDPANVVATTLQPCAIARCVQGGQNLTTVRGALYGTKRIVSHLF